MLSREPLLWWISTMDILKKKKKMSKETKKESKETLRGTYLANLAKALSMVG